MDTNEPVPSEAASVETEGLKPFLRFLIPSLIGLLLFLVPFPSEGGFTILFGLYSDWVNANFGFILVELMVAIAVAAAVAGAYHIAFKPDWEVSHPILHAVSAASPGWLFLRFVGAAIAIMVYFEVGPEVLRLEDTGQILVGDLAIAFSIVMLPACFLMPLLTEFGAMDFFGTIVAPAFKKLFRLPGRAAVDATASFISASNIGILVTGQQYRRGFYDGREAVVVATNFSVVSLPFALVISQVAKIGDMFFIWYMTAILACIVCAIITPRVPPISRIPATFVGGSANAERLRQAKKGPLLKRSLDNAISTAAHTPPVKELARLGNIMMFEQLFGIIGPLIALGTITAAVAFHSPIGEWISMPIAWLLSLFQVEDAVRVAPGFIFGFMDQYIPTIIASDLTSAPMRFILAGLSLCQLIFMTETGLVMIRVGLPVTVFQLFQIFVIRTIIVTPVLAITAMMLF